MVAVSELFIYPIKSLGGIAVSSATLTDRGFQHDRRWMLVDEHNKFLTQRESAKMALLQVELTPHGLNVFYKRNPAEAILIPFKPESIETSNIMVWSDRCKLQFVSAGADNWFSEILSFKCRLVFMPDSTRRRVDTRYALDKEITNLSDGYPLTVIGQASLDDLNNRLSESLPMNRFRPNIVITGTAPFEEDTLEHFTINTIDFYGVKRCARCIITTTDQESGERSKDPLQTLSTFRKQNNNIYFGQNLVHNKEGVIRVGDTLTIKKKKQESMNTN